MGAKHKPINIEALYSSLQINYFGGITDNTRINFSPTTF